MTDSFLDEHTNAQIAADGLRTTSAIRERCGQLLARARGGGSGWFEVDDRALDAAAHEVAQITRRRYRHLRVPMHSCWRDFEVGDIDRRGTLRDLLGTAPAVSRARAMIDLTVVSALLNCVVCADWKYTEAATGRTFMRRAGLGVANFHAFIAGLFSSDRHRPLQADARGLRSLGTDHLARAFQVSPANPLPGLEQHTILLRRLGEIMTEQPEVFGEDGRPGGLFDMMVSPLGPEIPHTADIDAHDILSQLLHTLSGLWPSDNRIGDVPVGDCWRHPAVRGEGETDGWIPLHKPSQWLTYCLLEPFEWAGVQVRGIDRLTGLPDDRNGGLLIDSGVLRLRNAQAAAHTWRSGDEIIIEWRALTVALLDELAPRVRALLRLDEAHLPLSCILEGGTWAAGRDLAQRLRGGLPPLRVSPDSTMG